MTSRNIHLQTSSKLLSEITTTNHFFINVTMTRQIGQLLQIGRLKITTPPKHKNTTHVRLNDEQKQDNSSVCLSLLISTACHDHISVLPLDSTGHVAVAWRVLCCFVISSMQLHIPLGALQKCSIIPAYFVIDLCGSSVVRLASQLCCVF